VAPQTPTSVPTVDIIVDDKPEPDPIPELSPAVIESIEAKASDEGVLYSGERAYVHGTGLSGNLTIKLGNIEPRYVYVTGISDTYAEFNVPSYSQKIYTSVKITNSSGKESNFYQVEVNVPIASDQNNTSKITVTYPNGGEQLGVGQGKDVDFRIWWNSSNLSGTAYVYLTSDTGTECLLGTAPVSQGNFAIMHGSYSCKNGTPSLSSGQYRVSIETDTLLSSGKSVNDRGDNYFTLIMAQPTPTVDLQICRDKCSNGPTTLEPGYTIFKWSSENSDSCTASGDYEWSGSKSVEGSEEIWTGNEKTGETTYKITCKNSSGSVSDSVTLKFQY